MSGPERQVSSGLEPIRSGRGGKAVGPRNRELELQNPDLLVPPATDHGTIANLWFPFSAAHNRLEHGGWAREVTARELPVATTLAGVNMHLNPGGVRELHWHKEAEWGYMLAGGARVTVIDPSGGSFIDDVRQGEIWNFPAGHPHSIQALEDGCEFLLVFDDGNFSENSTFLISDWFAHTPRPALARNFQADESAFADIPTGELYIFQGEIPGPLESDRRSRDADAPAISFTYRLKEQEAIRCPGGSVRIADSTNFRAAKTIAAALVEVEPGGMREMHWHPNADEWQYYLSGRARMTVFASAGRARTFDYREGDVGYVPRAMGHYIENVGEGTLTFLEMFRSDRFVDVSLRQWMALTPPQLLQAHLHLGEQVLRRLQAGKTIVTR